MVRRRPARRDTHILSDYSQLGDPTLNVDASRKARWPARQLNRRTSPPDPRLIGLKTHGAYGWISRGSGRARAGGRRGKHVRDDALSSWPVSRVYESEVDRPRAHRPPR